MANNDIKRTVSIFINDKEVNNTLAGVGSEIGRLKRELRQAERGSEDFNQKAKELREAKKVYGEMNDEIRETQAELDGANDSMGGFLEGFGNIRDGIAGGDLEMIQEGFGGIKNGIKGATRAAMAFIATPIGAAIAALVAIGASVKFLWDYNQQLHELNEELRALGVNSEELADVRSEVQGTAETFDKEFSDIAKKAKSLSVTFGISMSEANDVIARGLADGGKKNDEFLDSLGEYDVFFQDAGYSAQEFVDIVNTGFELGIYSDKLPDAIKEAGISLKEQTTATRDALVNAFGATFADDILDKIESGEMTVREGLEAIAKQSEKTGLTQQQQAQLTADIFRGAGEDVGGFMKIMEAVSKSAQRELSETAKAELELQEANERLNKAQAELFGISGFGDVWTKIKTATINAISGMLEHLQMMKVTASVVATEVTNFFIRLVNATIGALQNALEWASPFLEKIGVDVDNLKNKLENFKIDEVNWVINTEDNTEDVPTGPTDAEKKAAAEKAAAAKKAAEEAKRLADEEAERQKQAAEERKATERALTDFILSEQRKRTLEAMNENDREIALIDEKYKNKIDLAIAAEAKALEAAKNGDEAAKEQAREFFELRKELELAWEAELADALAEQEAERKEEEAAKKAEKEKERKEKEKEERLAEQEEKMEEAHEWVEQGLEILENQKILEAAIEGASAEEILGIKSDFARKAQAVHQFFDSSLKDLITGQVKFHELTEEQKVEMTRKGLATAAMMFNEGSDAWKAIKISETLITTYQSATNAFNSLSGIPVVGPALGAVAAALAVASGLAQVKKISSTQIPKMPKPKGGKGKKEGGYTGKEPIGRDKDGNVVGWVHEDEWVSPKWMTQSPKYAATIGWLEQERMKGLGGYATGGYTSAPPPNVPASAQKELTTGWKVLLPVLNQLVTTLNDGVTSKLYVGYEDAQKIEELNIERKQSEQNGTISQ